MISTKKISYDEVKSAFEERGYELISTEYIGIDKKLKYICSIHRDKGEQKIDYSHFKRGQRCRFCGKEHKRSGKEKPLEDYDAKELTESKGMEFVKIARENNVLNIYYICPKHRDKGVQKTTISSMRKKKVGCPYCIGRNKTTESFKKELLNINANIEIIGEYHSAKSPIRCKCLIDGYEWSAIPNSLLNRQGCPICGREKSTENKRKTNEMFLQELKEFNPNIIPLQEYIDAKNKILVSCSICGNEWVVAPDSLLNKKSRCPECVKIESHNRQAKSNEKFLEELHAINPMLEPLEPYYNNFKKILVRCKTHNYEWYTSPNKILHRKSGCPKCSAYSNEKKLIDILEKMDYQVHAQKRYDDCRDKNTLPFDLYVKELNLLIEYDGEGHYMPIRRGTMTEEAAQQQLKTVQKHDKIKTEYCLNNKIPLIRIPYWENKNLESFLMQKMMELDIF